MSVMDDLTGDDKTLATAAVMEALAGEHTPSDKWVRLAGRLCGRQLDAITSGQPTMMITGDDHEPLEGSSGSLAVISDLDCTYCTVDVRFPMGARPVLNVDADGCIVTDRGQAALQVTATHMVIGYIEDEDSEHDSVLYADGATVDAVNADGSIEEASWKRGDWYGNSPISIRKFLTSLGVDKIENHTDRKLG